MSNDGKNPEHQILEIDRLIHEPARYQIMALLYVIESADFIFIKNQTQLTSGNLSTHLSKLESAGYLNVTKEFVNRKPKTLLNLTDTGRIAFRKYGQQMKQLFKDIPE